MITYMDFTSPNVQFSYDLRNNPMFKKDSGNYINALSVHQLNTLGNVSLLDIFLSKTNIVEPHVHQNASELVYCISGAAVVSLVNPFAKKLVNIPIAPGQVANVPQGWWHYEIATVDDTHLLAIFDAPVPEFIAGSDLLRLTPANIWAHTYCLDAAKVQDTFAPITDTVVIGPPANCKTGGNVAAHREAGAVPPQEQQPQVQAYFPLSSQGHTYGQPAFAPQQHPVGYGWPYRG